MSEFSKKKITQSMYRGSAKAVSKEDKDFLNTDLPEIKVKDEKKFLFREKVVEEIRHFLSKLIPEDIIDNVLGGSCMKSIFKKLGL